MGSKSKFTCNDCGYAAKVSGGPDCGFIVRTKTGYCTTCEELVDYVTKVNVETDREIEIGVCGRCDSPITQDWNQGDVCPKCGGEFGEPTEFILWD